MGQEFVVAWSYLAFGATESLHVFAVRVMALVAALAVLGVFGVVLARTRSYAWALVASVIFSSLAANYRTIGFVLVREDLSLPLFAIHLALLARAVSRPGPRAFLLAGLAAAAAAATWHAMGFFLSVELLALHLWFVRGGPSPFELRGAWAVLVAPIVAAVLVPALAVSGFLLSAPMQLALALLFVAVARRRAASPGPRAFAWVAAPALAGTFALGRLLGPARSSYAHVFELLLAKLSHLGVRPVDPGEISFDARLLWQGPFETLPFGELFAWIGAIGALLGGASVALACVHRRRMAGFEAFVVALALVAIPVAWGIGRTVILLGLCVPLLLIVVHRALDERRRATALACIAVLALVQAASFARDLAQWELDWYMPVWRQDELAETVHWIAANVAPGEAVAADFVNSPAILAGSGASIVLQPKYETDASRRKAELFLTSFYTQPPAEFARVLRERFGARYLVVDTFLLGEPMRWTAGLTDAPAAGSAARALLGDERVPGFEEVFRTGTSELPSRRAGTRGGERRIYRVGER